MSVRLKVVVAGVITVASSAAAQVPASLIGKWKIQRIIPTERVGCWDADRARTLLGSTLTYQPHAMTWQGGQVPLIGIRAVVRTLTRTGFTAEYQASLDTLAIKDPSIQEVDLQHEDADVTGATTEIPGDTVILAAPGRIIVSACGIFYQAIRIKP